MIHRFSKIKIIRMWMFYSCAVILLMVTYFACTVRGSANASPEEKLNYLKTSVLAAFENDAVKTTAATFIIDCLGSRNHTGGEIIGMYNDTIQKYAHDKDQQLVALTALKEKQHDLITTSEPAVIGLTPEYLIHHVNLAVNNYKKYKWNKEVDLESFCHYVLPYQINTESPGDWINYCQKEYLQDNDSSIFYEDLQGRINLALQWLKKRKEGFKIKILNVPEVSVEVADKLHFGTCHELTKVSVSVLRAFGIPATIDFTPLYSNRNGEHEWAVIVQQNSNKVINIATGKVEMDIDTLEKHMPKVYRKNFKEIKGNHVAKRGYKSSLPVHFNDPFTTDVTNIYRKTFDVTMPVHSHSAIRYGYLAVFSYQEWTPVAWGEFKRDAIHFQNVASNTIYIALSLNDKTDFISAPFLLTASGDVQYLEADLSHTERVTLTRKYPLFSKIQFFIDRMIGGQFQGSNDSGFIDYDILYKIVSEPGANYNHINLKGTQKYRYARYIGPPGAQCNISEAEFYGYNTAMPLTGRVIGTDGSWENDTTRTRDAVFDGNPLTFFDCKNPDGGWAGIDFGSLQSIQAIRFIARTDVNIIVKGNVYELFYWKDSWKSLGKKTADTSMLTYDSVPTKSLLLLKNLTGGMEERIFQYENKKQVWR
jgi:hypothetical protein